MQSFRFSLKNVIRHTLARGHWPILGLQKESLFDGLHLAFALPMTGQ